MTARIHHGEHLGTLTGPTGPLPDNADRRAVIATS
jgi:hypothetical protein